MHYTRINPKDPDDIRQHLKWRRFVHTVDPDNSPDNGQWVELPERIRYSASELLEQVEISPRLLGGNGGVAGTR